MFYSGRFQVNEAIMKHLYIIGNGFDIFTGLKTRYIDFRWWLENNYAFVYEEFVKTYDLKDDKLEEEWWNNFESMIGELNIEQYVSENTQKYSSTDKLTKNIRYKRQLEENRKNVHNIHFSTPCSSRLKGLFGVLEYCLSQWVLSAMKCIEGPHYTILERENSLFLNFNYTDTLESIYEIPPDRVIHIHGSVKKNEHLIFGHNHHRYEREKCGYDGNKVAGVINQYEKNPHINISNDFLNSIKHVEQIHIYGFSFSDVDIPYLERIIEVTDTNCNWEISWFSDDDNDRIKWFILEHPILMGHYKKIQLKEVSI